MTGKGNQVVLDQCTVAMETDMHDGYGVPRGLHLQHFALMMIEKKHKLNMALNM